MTPREGSSGGSPRRPFRRDDVKEGSTSLKSGGPAAKAARNAGYAAFASAIALGPRCTLGSATTATAPSPGREPRRSEPP